MRQQFCHSRHCLELPPHSANTRPFRHYTPRKMCRSAASSLHAACSKKASDRPRPPLSLGQVGLTLKQQGSEPFEVLRHQRPGPSHGLGAVLQLLHYGHRVSPVDLQSWIHVALRFRSALTSTPRRPWNGSQCVAAKTYAPSAGVLGDIDGSRTARPRAERRPEWASCGPLSPSLPGS